MAKCRRSRKESIEEYMDRYKSRYEDDASSPAVITNNLVEDYSTKPKDSLAVTPAVSVIHPVQNFTDAVNILLPAIKKARGNGRGKNWYKKKVKTADGSIVQYWVYRKQFSYRGIKYRLDCIGGHSEFLPRKKQIIKEADLLVTNFNPNDRKATYSEAFIPFLDDEEVKQESLDRRSSIFKVWIEPDLGKHIVYETNGKQVDDFFKSVKKKANDKKSLKNPPSMVKEIYNVLNAFYNFCHDSQRFILENPTMPKTRRWINKKLKNHKAEQDDKKGIDVSQVIMLMKHMSGKAYEIVYHWMCYHGMRSSEALGIEWKHVDFQKNRVLIRQQTGRNNGKRFIKPYTKTNEKRYVELAPQTKELLLELLEGVPISKKEGLVFTKLNGDIDIEVDFHKRVHLKSLFELGLIENRKIASPNDTVLREKHGLRIFFSSYQQKKGMDLATVSKWLGHKDKNTTLKHYTQVLYNDDNVTGTNNLMSNFLNEDSESVTNKSAGAYLKQVVGQ